MSDDQGMSKIVQTIAGASLPLILIFGFYVIAHGHLTPGGGFQGGAVVASGLVMLIIAFGSKWTMDKIKEKNLSIIESLGALGFIGLAFFGIIYGGVFFKNFLANSGGVFGTAIELGNTAADINTAGVLPLMNFAVGIKVIAGLFAIVLVIAYATSGSKKGGSD